VTIRKTVALSTLAVGMFVASLPTMASAASVEADAHRSTPSPRRVLADVDGDRIADPLDRRLAHATGRIDVVATFTDRGSMRAARSAVGRVTTTFTLIDGFEAMLTGGQIRALAALPGTIRVEPNFRVEALDDAANDDFGATAARTNLGVTGAGVEICIPDSGVDLGHEQLDSKAPIGWLDLIDGQASPYDDLGHGTHVASIALGDGVGGPNAAAMQGVAPAAELSAVKVIDHTGYGDDSVAVQGIEWCAGRSSVGVISLSLGSVLSSDGLDAMSQAVNAAVQSGKIVTAAAGNSGDVPDSITAPGSSTGAITVGAVADWSAPAGSPYASSGPYLAPFSSRGPTIDDRVKPDIVAPGVSIGAAQSDTTSTYVVHDGTSMATPYVAGIAALIKQEQPGWNQAAVRAAIEGTASDAGPAGKDPDWGAGLLDGYAAVAEAAGVTGASSFPQTQRFTGSVANNGSWSQTFDLTADQLDAPIAVTLTLNGTYECVIDLGPLGCFMYAWSPDLEAELSGPSGFVIDSSTCPAGDVCAIGRQETLDVRPSEAGTYTIRVFPAGDGDGSGGSFAVDLFTGPVGAPPPPPPPPPPSTSHVDDIDGSSVWLTATRWRARATIEVVDGADAVLSGATVTGTWTGNTTSSCVTSQDGRCSVQKRFPKKRTSATFTITSIQIGGYTYTPADNGDPDGDSTGTSIVIARPL
jgi:serine protease AprX